MNNSTRLYRPGRLATALVGMLLVSCLLSPRPANAADPLFVGVLSLTEDSAVADELGLSDEQKQKLLDLIVARESDALELALKLRDLTPGERAEKLAPFRRESEEKGLSLLTDAQKKRLEQIRIRRLGLASLAEPAIAERLKLDGDQQEKVASLLRERVDRTAGVDKDKQYVVQSEIERKLAAVLTAEQTAAWDAMIAAATPAGAAAAKPTETPAAESAPAEASANTEMTTQPESKEPAAEATASAGPASFPDDTTAKPDVPTAAPGETAAAPAEAATAPGETAAEKPGTMASTETPAEPGEKSTPAVAPDQVTETPEPPAEATASVPAKDKEVKLRFSFRYQPWADVLEWFAKQADLSLIMDAPPSGTLNYTDDREYTPAEAIDLLNSVLLTKGYTLIRRNRMLMLINLEDGIPPNLVPTISLDDLDNRGEYELVGVLFQLDKLSPEELEPEIKKMIGPQGSVVSLPKARQILVIETAGRLRAIRRTIQRSEDPEGRDSSEIRTLNVKYIDPEQALGVIRQFLDIAPEQSTPADGSVKVVIDPTGKSLLVTGTPEKMARVAEVLKAVDTPEAAPAPVGIDQTPQLEVYTINTADPQSVLQVMQTLLAGSPDARLAVDPKTGNLVALARPAEQATIKATLDQMQRDSRKIEVIQLYTVDPQLAVASINKMFGITGDTPDPNKPQIDSDAMSRQLIIRATDAQIEQIRSLLEKMGESPAGEGGEGVASNVRTLPITGRAAEMALERAQEIWPTMRKNRIRVVTPASSGIPTLTPGQSAAPTGTTGGQDVPLDLLENLFGPTRPHGTLGPAERAPGGESSPDAMPPKSPPPTGPPAPTATKPPVKTTTNPPPPDRRQPDRSARYLPPQRPAGARVLLVAQSGDPAPAASAPAAPPKAKAKAKAKPKAKAPHSETPSKPQAAAEKPAAPKTDGEPSPIVVTVGPGGIVIASEDTEALDEFENLLNTLSGSAFAGNTDVTIFYLKNAKAEVIAETLDRIFGGGTGEAGGAGGGGLLGDIAGAALGDAGGGFLGSLLGLGGPGGGGAVAPSGAIQITPDPRLNALVVQANPADTEMIEQLLKILDQKESPEEILVEPKPRVIPLMNAQASEIADIVKQVYQDRLVSGGGAGARQPSPQEFLQMLRGGGRRGGSGGGAGGSQGAADIQQKMAIGIDSRNNSLIVVAPDLLYQEVLQLVQQVDAAAGQSNQTMRVVTLQHSNPSAVQQALSALVGENVQFGRTTTATPSAPSTGGAPANGGSAPQATMAIPPMIQQQMMRGNMPSSRRSSGSSRTGSSRSSSSRGR